MSRKQFADLDFQSVSRIRNLPAPQNNDEPVRLTELNNAIEGLKQKDPAVVGTQGNLNLSSPGATIDGVTLASGNRVLVKAQTTQSENGLYIWNGAAVAMTRAADANTAAELNGALVPVTGGTNAGTNWRQTATVTTLGSDNVTWAQFGTSASQATETSAGVAELATQAETDTGTDDLRIVTPLKLTNWSGRKRKFTATFGDGSATQYDHTHNFNTRDVQVAVYRNSTPWDDVEVDVERPDANTVRVRFTSAPASNAYNIVIIG
ncbi:MAG TPA: hypothetical protein VNQ79_15870 [Blastocatellia bacterium]|nr:hypothetical protein [Blastocatellia bacterium]